jgi:PEP-CTERM motif
MNANSATRTPSRSAFTRGLLLAALAALFAILPSAVRADSNTSYDISGTLANGSTFSGVLDFDTNNTGVTTLVNSTFTVGGVAFTCNGASSNNCIVQNNGPLQYFQDQSGGSLVVIFWNTVSFPNPPAGLTFDGGYCMNCGASGMISITGGAGVAAPEPSTLALLVLSLFAAAFLARTKKPRVVA